MDENRINSGLSPIVGRSTELKRSGNVDADPDHDNSQAYQDQRRQVDKEAEERAEEAERLKKRLEELIGSEDDEDFGSDPLITALEREKVLHPSRRIQLNKDEPDFSSPDFDPPPLPKRVYRTGAEVHDVAEREEVVDAFQDADAELSLAADSEAEDEQDEPITGRIDLDA